MLIDNYLINFISISIATWYFYRKLAFFLPGKIIKLLLKTALMAISIAIGLNLVNFIATFVWQNYVVNDPNFCNKLQEDKKDVCLSLAAERNLNETLCFEIQKLNGRGSRNTCIYNIARKKHDIDLCQKISTTEKFEGVEYNTDYCLMAIATDQADPEICDFIQRLTGPEFDDPLKAEDIASKERCYGEAGVAAKDKSWCDKAGKYKDLCINNID